MAELPPDIDLLTALQHNTFQRYFLAAGVALYVYDILICLDTEVKYIWATFRSRKHPINRATIIFNLLYLTQRYLPILDQVIIPLYILLGTSNSRECSIAITLSTWLVFVGLPLSELLLTFRIWAVWKRKKSIGIILAVVPSVLGIPSLIFTIRTVKGIQYPDLHLSGRLERCIYYTKNKDMYVCWVMLMIYDTVNFTLMAIPGFKAYQTGGSSELMLSIYRDGIFYYVLIFMVSLIDVIVTLLLPADLIFIISNLERVLHTLFASHAILHIREVASSRHTQHTTYALSEITFQSGTDSDRTGTEQSQGGVEHATSTSRST